MVVSLRSFKSFKTSILDCMYTIKGFQSLNLLTIKLNDFFKMYGLQQIIFISFESKICFLFNFDNKEWGSNTSASGVYTFILLSVTVIFNPSPYFQSIILKLFPNIWRKKNL